MNGMTTPTDLAQALRELIAHTKGCEVLLDIPEQPTTTAAREALAAHDSRAQPASVPDGWMLVPKHNVTSDMVRVGMEWITNCQTDFDRACMVTCIFGEMCKVAPQPTSIEGLSKGDLIRRAGNVNESVPVPASGAQEEAPAVVDVGLDSAEHDLKTTVLAGPHGAESTPVAEGRPASGVTDDMVDRACDAYDKYCPDAPIAHDEGMRVALEAVLAQPANVVDGWALTKLRDHEAACEACGRAVWDGKDEAHCIGFLAPCGRRVARLLDCGTVDCIKAVAAAP